MQAMRFTKMSELVKIRSTKLRAFGDAKEKVKKDDDS